MLFKNKWTILGLAVVVGIGIWYSLPSDSSSDDLLVSEDLTGASGPIDQELVATLLELRSVTLSGTIFSDPVFQSLKDFGVQIVPEPAGRANPFAPLNSQEAVVPTQTPVDTDL